jgi:hypothetical protein
MFKSIGTFFVALMILLVGEIVNAQVAPNYFSYTGYAGLSGGQDTYTTPWPVQSMVVSSLTYSGPNEMSLAIGNCPIGVPIGSCHFGIRWCYDTPGVYNSTISFRASLVSSDGTLSPGHDADVIYTITILENPNSSSRCQPVVTPSPTPAVTPTPTPSVDISVSSVRLAQVVYNPQFTTSAELPLGDNYLPLISAETSNFTAVLGKSASFSPIIKLKNPDGVSLSGTYTVVIKDSNNLVVSQSQPLDVSTLSSSGQYEISASQMAPLSPQQSFIPAVVGNSSLKAVVVASLNASVTSTIKDLSVSTIKTYSPTIGLMKVSGTDSRKYKNVSASSFNQFMSLSGYLSSVLPVSDNSIQLKDSGAIYGALNLSKKDTIVNDVMLLDARRRILNLNRALAVVDPSYMAYIDDISTEGYVYPLVSHVAIVNGANLGSLPHELGHTFGVGYELNKATTPSHDRLFNGYNASFTGPIGVSIQKPSFMDETLIFPETPTNMPWVDDRTYSLIFNYLRFPIIDPKTILVSGILSDTGSVSQLAVFDIPNGVATSSQSGGDLSINTLDKNGILLNSVTIKSDFRRRVRRAPGDTRPSIEVGTLAPISVELPASPNIAYVQVKQNQKEILKSSIIGGLLVSTINRIPLTAFKAIGCIRPADKLLFAQKEKDVLVKLAIAAQKVMDSKNPQVAPILLDGIVLGIKAVTSNTFISMDAFDLSPNDAVAQIKLIKKNFQDNYVKGK